MEQLNTLNLLEELDAKTLSAFFKLMSEEIRFQLIFVLVHEKKITLIIAYCQ